MYDDPTATPCRNAQAFLLRLWPGGSNQRWYATLEGVQSSQRQRFSTPEALLAFLAAERTPPTDTPANRPPADDGYC